MVHHDVKIADLSCLVRIGPLESLSAAEALIGVRNFVGGFWNQSETKQRVWGKYEDPILSLHGLTKSSNGTTLVFLPRNDFGFGSGCNKSGNFCSLLPEYKRKVTSAESNLFEASLP